MDSTTVAYHEAGHAVLAHITGVYVIDGPITTTGLDAAETPIMREAAFCVARSNAIGDVTQDQLNYETAIIAAAGQAAERIYLRKQGLPVDEQRLAQGAFGDLQLVNELLGPKHWFDVCEAASKYLQEPKTWPIVDKLAKAILQKSGILTKDQATVILESVGASLDIPTVRVLRRNYSPD
jgi:hypothetical protein